MSNLVRELRLAARTLTRKPGFSTVSVSTVAIAVAACTVIYSIVHGVLIRPLPYPDSDSLVQVWQVNRGSSSREGQFSDANFEDLRDGSRAFAALGQYGTGMSTVIAGNTPLRVQTSRVSVQFFDVFQSEAVRGRLFGPEDAHIGAAPVAVVSHGFWERAMREADLGSASIKVDDRRHLVIGVMPPEFQFPERTEVWLPREQIQRNAYRTGHNWRVVGRLADGVPLAVARGDVTAVARRLEALLRDDTHMVDAALVPLQDQITGPVRTPLMILLAAVACLVVIACANLVNLLIVNVSRRRRELAVRAALGAGRTSLAQPMIAETMLLTGIGGVLGICLGAAGLRTAVLLAPNLPRLSEIGLSWPVLLVSLGVTAATALVLGIAVAWRSARTDISDSLKQGQRGQAGSVGTTRLQNGLVVTQFAVSLVLLVAAGLLGRSLAVLLAQDPGFRTERVLVLDLTVPGGTPDLEARRVQLYQQLLERLRDLPGVRAAGGVNQFPLGRAYSNGTFVKVRGDEPMQSLEQIAELGKDASRTGSAEFRAVTPHYFTAMGIPLLQGRAFEEGDTGAAPHVAVISESLARASWPDTDPRGRKVQFGGMDGDLRVFTIVGVVGDIREQTLDSGARPTFYVDYRQRPRVTGAFTLVIQTEGDPLSVAAPARAAIHELDPEIAPRFRSVEEVFAASVADRRFSLLVLGAFAGVALLLALLGIYGVLSYAVAQRTQEFGIRLALGARRMDVWKLVVRQSVALVGSGVLIGLVATYFSTRLIQSMLYNVSATDPITLAAVVAVLAVTALGACHFPALRAMRADPLMALRSE